MKPSNAFKETIKNYLDKRAAEDELFAETYKKENKTIDECCNYVLQCAKQGGCEGYADDEVFGWAVHYYDEDDIKNIKPIKAKVVVNHTVEDEKRLPLSTDIEWKRPTSKKAKKESKTVEQVSLFS